MAVWSPRATRPLVVPALISINVIVFLMWTMAGSEGVEFMVNNFTVSWTSLREGRYWVLLTSVFSHNALFHILLNMFVLNSFGSLLEAVLGRGSFLRFYLVAGVISSFCHAFVSAYLLGAPDLPAVGASGAVSGLVLVFAMIFPREKILVFGLIPVPALFGALAFIGLDIWGLVMQAEGGGLPIGHGAHLGGAFTGVFYYILVLRGRRRGRFA
ncbi:MAG: rhomboid family intramembrane serine protease [Bdellovibrionales bacterium]